MAYSPDGKRILPAGNDNTVKVWDTEKGTVVLTLEGHTNDITSVVYSRDGKRILSGSWDKTLKVWDADIVPSAPPPKQGRR